MLKRVLITAVAMVIGAPNLQAQEDDPEQRAQIAERIRELSRELAELQQQQMGFRNMFFFADPDTNVEVDAPLGLMFSANRARLGVLIQTRADEAVDSIGALIEEVTEGAPADEGGLQAGDIVTSFAGEPLTGRYPPAGDYESAPAVKLVDLVQDYEPGDTVVVEYRRGRDNRTTTVVLDRSQGSFSYRFSTPDDGEGMARAWAGTGDAPFGVLREYTAPDIEATLRIVGEFADMELVSLNDQLGEYFGTTEGVLVITAPDEAYGLRGGDVILRIGARQVDDPSRVFRILSSYEPGEEVSMEIMRDQRRETVAGTVPERNRGIYRMRTPRR